MTNQTLKCFFVGTQHVSMWNKILACCELHTKPYMIVMILSKYFFTIIQYNKGRRVGVGGWKFLKKEGLTNCYG